jgi:enoyl-CoA hydratase/carnithine racemase
LCGYRAASQHPLFRIQLFCDLHRKRARMVDAAEAERLGLVRKLPADNFLTKVQSQTASPPVVFPVARGSLGAIARELVTTSSPPVADKEMLASFGSEDFREGVAHFVEKRAAAFSGG